MSTATKPSGRTRHLSSQRKSRSTVVPIKTGRRQQRDLEGRPPLAGGAMITASDLVKPLNGKEPQHTENRLEDIDRIVVLTILASKTDEPWVLVDRNLFLKKGQSSKIYIALRRRGFDVVVRHVGGVKNYWARWPHELPTMPELPEFEGVEVGQYGAVN